MNDLHNIFPEEKLEKIYNTRIFLLKLAYIKKDSWKIIFLIYRIEFRTKYCTYFNRNNYI